MAASSSIVNGDPNVHGDPLYLSNSDHHAMLLTAKQFDGNNFMNWSRSARMSLGAKLKLGFLDGKTVKPAETSRDYLRWTKCDYMVRCWLLNSLVPDIAEGFMCAQSAKLLWEELNERFGQPNGPLLYQLQRDSSHVAQGNDHVSVYFSKLKRVWDELHAIDEMPVCKCGAMNSCKCDLIKKFKEIDERNKLLQFLMGLNAGHENVRNQILGMDPLPSVNRAYYLVQQIEKQREVTEVINAGTEGAALAAQRNQVKPTPNSNYSGYNQNSNGYRKDFKKSKQDRFCTHCNIKGHTVDQCFKIHGYPDWYKGDKGKMNSKIVANVGTGVESSNYDDPLSFDSNSVSHSNVDPNLLNAVCQEVMKILKGKQQASSNMIASTSLNTDSANPSDFANFAGPYY